MCCFPCTQATAAGQGRYMMREATSARSATSMSTAMSTPITASGPDTPERTSANRQPSRSSEQPVGLRSVPDHHHAGRVERPLRRADGRCDQVGHRLMGLATDERCRVGRGRDRREDRAAARLQTARRGIGGVGVGPDQLGAGPHRRRGDRQASEVEVAVQPDDHGVEALGVDRPVVDDGLGPTSLDGLDHAWTCGHQHPRRRLDQSCGRHRRAHDVSVGGHADRFERPFVLGLDNGGVVGDEEHAYAGGAQALDRLDRSGDRLVREPHDPVEVTEHRLDAIRCVHRSIVAGPGPNDGILSGCRDSRRSPPCATAIARSTT